MNTAEKVQNLWPTPVMPGRIDVTPLVNAEALAAVMAAGAPQAQADPGAVLVDREGLERELLEAFAALAAEEGRPAPSGIDLQIQIWRGGYDLPSAGYPADYVAWCFLNTGEQRVHDESGAVSVADPRAGSAMTAMPGLPFGRQMIIRHRAGAMLAVPGWLTCSVVPVETGQVAIVAFATSRQ